MLTLAIPAIASAETLQAMADSIAQRSPMNRAQLGVFAVEATTGRVLVSRQADHGFTPASSFKLLLTATALDVLGPQFRFKTQLIARGSITGSRLNGDLILVGGGDPVLTSKDLDDAATAVARAGIRQISGTVLADATLFDQRRWGPDWAWDGTPFYYQAPIQALAIDEGTVGVVITPGAQTGDAVSAKLLQPSGAYTIASRAVMGTGPYDDPARCSRLFGTTQILIVGRVALGESQETVHCAVEDTAEFAAQVMRSALSSAGISVGRNPVGARPPNVPLDVIDDSPLPAQARYPGSRVLWAHESPTLIELLHTMLPKSDNFIAEHIEKMLAVEKLSQRGNFIGGATVEQRFAVNQLGIDRDSLDIQDGSGLSAADRITPRGLVAVLRWTAKQPYGTDFINALPRAGMDGTLANRLTGTDAVGRVRAKSGYMQHTIALAGYADTLHHGRVIFA
ncbi:MAG TPA: D-alanyl-D-alanine carboxypeptidase/D-alanyl-D-alanine-endopeptidase, partial [Magnetospirillaceae bacterium]|nr:D-alanyl-D-alanine carboxypeptidase/D-alanyl-D-alanine-endopeptidase [Magnetospirillaceae bacterium]